MIIYRYREIIDILDNNIIIDQFINKLSLLFLGVFNPSPWNIFCCSNWFFFLHLRSVSVTESHLFARSWDGYAFWWNLILLVVLTCHVGSASGDAMQSWWWTAFSLVHVALNYLCLIMRHRILSIFLFPHFHFLRSQPLTPIS